MDQVLHIAAPAKINLHLRVFPVAADGFHPLRSWFRTVELFDELAVTPVHEHPSPAPPGSDAQVDLRCGDATVPRDGRNLIVKAWEQMVGEGPEWVQVELNKRIPIGGGLGGGSSDAAAAIAAYRLARRQLTLTEPSRAEMLEAGTSIGSDVPFFVHHQLDRVTDAVCTGRGEIVKPFRPGRRHAVLLILPGLHVSTPAVYRQFDALPAPPEDGSPDFETWSHLPARELLPLLRNDLEPPAFALHPELGRLRADLEQRLGRIVRMTGSGSTLFTLYDTRDEARAAADAVSGAAGPSAIVA